VRKWESATTSKQVPWSSFALLGEDCQAEKWRRAGVDQKRGALAPHSYVIVRLGRGIEHSRDSESCGEAAADCIPRFRGE
jgi:hypothetical protein